MPNHLENAKLNDFEAQSGFDLLESFPVAVGLNMGSVCNAHCVFCSYQPKTQPKKDFIKLDDIKKMDWLKYVSTFYIWCGIGDSLANSEFFDCYDYLKYNFPHLDITLSTNGIGLTDDINYQLAGHCKDFNISLNAATRDLWAKLMRSTPDKFDHIINMYSCLIGNRNNKNSELPFARLSMVITKDNIYESVLFAELAHEIGVDHITYTHYVPTTLVGHRDMPIEQSLYYHQQECDEWMIKCQDKANSLDLKIMKPLPFSDKDFVLSHGTPVKSKPEICHDPWKTCYLTVDEDGNRQMIFCCSGFYYEIGYDKSDLTEENFKKIWNHPTARYFRKTANNIEDNPVCSFCNSHDHFDPEDHRIYDLGKRVKPIFEQVNNNIEQSNIAHNLSKICQTQTIAQ